MTLHYTTPTPHHTQLHYSTPTLHYITFQYTHYITTKCKCNYATLTTHSNNYNSTTLQLQLQLHYTTLHPAVMDEVTDQVTTATIAATPKKTAPTTFPSISRFTLPSVVHNNQSPIGFLCLKLPPPPCAVLLVKLDEFQCQNLYSTQHAY